MVDEKVHINFWAKVVLCGLASIIISMAIYTAGMWTVPASIRLYYGPCTNEQAQLVNNSFMLIRTVIILVTVWLFESFARKYAYRVRKNRVSITFWEKVFLCGLLSIVSSFAIYTSGIWTVPASIRMYVGPCTDAQGQFINDSFLLMRTLAMIPYFWVFEIFLRRFAYVIIPVNDRGKP